MVVSFWLGFALTRGDLHGCSAGPCSDHRGEVGTALVLRTVSVVDPIIDGSVDGFKVNLFGDACGRDAARLLTQSGLIPSGLLSVVGAHVECVIEDHRPNPSGSAIGFSVVAER